MITRMFKSFFISLLCIVLVGCSNDDDNNQSLPPETQIGAGTFACKVNGVSFIDTSGGYFNCFYQFVDGGYYFGIKGNDDDFKRSNLPWSISLATTKKTISEGELLKLKTISNGNASGDVGFLFSITDSHSATTGDHSTGELLITKFDLVNNIVSGTFWFDIEHPITGETVEIREGRFDTLFTQ